jgi:hypothetical protein
MEIISKFNALNTPNAVLVQSNIDDITQQTESAVEEGKEIEQQLSSAATSSGSNPDNELKALVGHTATDKAGNSYTITDADSSSLGIVIDSAHTEQHLHIGFTVTETDPISHDTHTVSHSDSGMSTTTEKTQDIYSVPFLEISDVSEASALGDSSLPSFTYVFLYTHSCTLVHTVVSDDQGRDQDDPVTRTDEKITVGFSTEDQARNFLGAIRARMKTGTSTFGGPSAVSSRQADNQSPSSSNLTSASSTDSLDQNQTPPANPENQISSSQNQPAISSATPTLTDNGQSAPVPPQAAMATTNTVAQTSPTPPQFTSSDNNTPQPAPPTTDSPTQTQAFTPDATPQPNATPSDTSTSSTQDPPTQNDHNLSDFVKKWCQDNASNDPTVWSGDFASEVNYCYYEGPGLAAQDFIEEDRRKLIDRWPKRAYHFNAISPSLINGQQAHASISYDWTYNSTIKGVRNGTCGVDMYLVWDGSSWHINSYKETVHRQ